MKFCPIIQSPARCPLELLLKKICDHFLSPEELIRRIMHENMHTEIH